MTVRAKYAPRDTGATVFPTKIPIGKTMLLVTIPMVVVLDLANGLLGEGARIPLLQTTPGELGRSLLLLGGLVVLIKLRGPYFRTLQRWWLVLLALGLVGPVLALVARANLTAFAFDVEKLSKALYGPTLIFLFTAIYVRFREIRLSHVLGTIALWGAIAGLGILTFKIAGIGEATYGRFSGAHKGLFLAQNDLGLGMLIALTASTHLLLRKPRLRHLLAFVLTVAGMMVLGTRAATIGAFAVPIVLLLFRTKRLLSERRRLLSYAAGGVAVLGVLTIVAQAQVQRITTEQYQARKYTRLVEGEVTRVLLLSSAYSYVSKRSLASDLFGDGAYRYQSGVAKALPGGEERELAEVDWMDLFGSHGIVFVAAVYAFYVAFFLFAGSLRKEDPLAPWTVRVMLAMYVVHASLAGHALASPLPTGVIAAALAYAWYRHRGMQLSGGRADREVSRARRGEPRPVTA